MLKFKLKLRLNSTVKAKCDRHPSYDPSTKGKDYIEDRCASCKDILDLYEAKIHLELALKSFERRAEAWMPERRFRKPSQ